MSTESDTDTDKKPSVGDQLKQGRLRQRLSIVECAKRTHISARYLEALEEEHWNDLPSESHRIGFLRLYARFLGVPSEEIIGLYQHRNEGMPAPKPFPPRASRPSPVPTPKSGWYPGSWLQLTGVAIVGLVVAWGVYHLIRRQIPEHHAVSIVRMRPGQSPRLLPPRAQVAAQKVRIQASADSWLRVVTGERLLFEGILPAGATKEWSGPGPFDLKIGHVKGISVFWNDQAVDIQSSAQGQINELRLPLAK